MSEIFTVNPELAGISPVPAPMQAGSCSFHNGLTVHGAGANMTPGFRRAMTCAFMPDGSTFNGIRNVLPESYFNSLRIGDVLNNSEQNPLIFKKSQ
jgi:ectoine hydroxylase-related dioxygenase (phytanoyl-CoA dioxygenase family)